MSSALAHAIVVFGRLPGLAQIGFPVGIAFIGYCILHRSAKKHEEQYWARRYQQVNPPDELVDNHVAPGAYIAAAVFVLCSIGAFSLVAQVIH